MPTSVTATHKLLALDANMMGITDSAMASIATFRARFGVHPCLRKNDESHPPPILPTSAIR